MVWWAWQVVRASHALSGLLLKPALNGDFVGECPMIRMRPAHRSRATPRPGPNTPSPSPLWPAARARHARSEPGMRGTDPQPRSVRPDSIKFSLRLYLGRRLPVAAQNSGRSTQNCVALDDKPQKMPAWPNNEK